MIVSQDSRSNDAVLTSDQTASRETIRRWCCRDFGIGGRMRASQINDDVLNRLRAAGEEIARGRLVERLWSVHDRPGHEPALAVVADASPAGPTHRNVTRLGQLQETLVSGRIPMRGDSAPGKRYQLARIGIVRGRMRRSSGCADHTRHHRLAAFEKLDVDPLGPKAERC